MGPYGKRNMRHRLHISFFYGIVKAEGEAMNKEQRKKMIAPVIITLIFVGYLAVYIYLLFFAAAVTTPLLIMLAVPLAGLGVGMIWTLITRIREIDKGEEDDLSNY